MRDRKRFSVLSESESLDLVADDCSLSATDAGMALSPEGGTGDSYKMRSCNKNIYTNTLYIRIRVCTVQ